MIQRFAKQRELRTILDVIRDSEATEEQLQRMETLVVDCREARQYVVRQLHLQASLHWAAALAPVDSSAIHAPHAEANAVDKAVSPVFALLGSVTNRQAWYAHPFRFSITVAILTLVVWCGLYFLVVSTLQNHNEIAERPTETLPPVVATLWQAADARWGGDPAVAPTPGVHLRQGQLLELELGQAEIRFDTGASVILEGPGEFVLLGKNLGNLRVGQLVAQVPPAARGFTVRTSHAAVVDLGTEFGLAVDADGRADVHVFEGMVSLELNQTTNGQEDQPIQRIVMADETVRFDPNSGTLQTAPKDLARKFVRAMPQKAKQGVTHPLVLRNPSFEWPDIRRHPKFSVRGRELQIPVIGWYTSDFPEAGVPGDMGCQGQYAISDNGEKPIIPPATDGNQLMWLCLDKNYPEFHEGWVYQSLGIVDQQDVGRRLRVSVDVSAKSYYMGPRDGPCEGAAVNVAFVTDVEAMQSGQVVGNPGTWPEMLVEHGWKTLTATLTITPEMVDQELFVRLMASDPEPRSQRDAYQWDNVRCVVEPSPGKP